MDFKEKQEFYSGMSNVDKSLVFDVVNSVFLKLKGQEKVNLKKTFVHVWKVNKSVGCFELIMYLYRSMETLEKQEALVTEEITRGLIPRDWKTQTIPWRRHQGICLNLHEEIEELEQQIGGGKGFISMEDHDNEMNELKRELKHKYEDKIQSLEKQIKREKFKQDKEMRSAEMDKKHQDHLWKQEKALQEIKDAGIDIPTANKT